MMRKLLSLIAVILGATSLHGADRPNVLLICVDDLRPELSSFGVDYIHSPHIDRLASQGRAFQRHYVQAPTCGASRYTLLTGRYGPYGNGALFARGRRVLSESDAAERPSLPAYFRSSGYTTVSVGKVSHHPGGRGGSDWDDSNELEMPLSWDRHLLPAGPWLHPRGAMHGLAHGEIRGNAKDMDLFQATPGEDSIYPDGLIVEEALSQMDALSAAANERPFFLAVGIIRPHLPFGAPEKYRRLYDDVPLPVADNLAKPEGKTTWHGSGEFMKYNRWGRNPNTDPEFALEVRRHYAACVSYADALVGRLLERLEASGLADNTIVALWGDHGWSLGEHAIWGKHHLFDEGLRSPLIIRAPQVERAGEATDAIVETIDLFPTLCELAGLPAPNFVDGTSLAPQLRDPNAKGRAAFGYTNARTVRTERYRLIEHRDGHIELYDHQDDPGETRNVAAAQPEVVAALTERLRERLGEPRAARN